MDLLTIQLLLALHTFGPAKPARGDDPRSAFVKGYVERLGSRAADGTVIVLVAIVLYCMRLL